MRKPTYIRTIFIMTCILFIFAFISICIGRFSSNPVDVYHAILGKLGLEPTADEGMEVVLFSIRIPRVFASMMIGAMLSLSGAVYQGVFRNPLVSPDILGVSAGASVGAASAIMLGLGIWERQVFAFLLGILAVGLSTTIPKLMRNHSNLMLVLSGIIVGGFLNSLLAIMKFVSDEQTELAAIVFWQMGSFAEIDMQEVAAISPVLLLGAVLLIGLSWRINILSFGEVEAKIVGMNTKQIRGITIACASLLTASAVSICGTIGWIGLVIPHLARLVVGSDHVKMIPVTALLGAMFMLFVDTVARALLTVEIPLSILTGIIGAPCFTWLLYKQRATVS